MMKFLKYAFAILGYVLAIAVAIWPVINTGSTEKKLAAQLSQLAKVKQNPVSTFVDSAGREHVKYPDGTVAKLPENVANQTLYKFLRDSVLSPTDILGKPTVTITSTSTVETKTTGEVSKKILDSLPFQESIQVDAWLTLYPNKIGGFRYAIDQGLNRTTYTQRSGLFNLKKTPYITFFNDNPNAKVTGYSKYDFPLPVVQPVLKVYGEADYDIALKQPRTDIGASIRLGKFEAIGYGRLAYKIDDLPPLTINPKAFTPSYGVKLRYNFIEL